jgi:hypothetical protein
LTLVSKNALLKEFAKNPNVHHFPIGKNHQIHLAKTTRVLSLQIWASLEQSHPICTFLPSKAPWGPRGPLGVKLKLSLLYFVESFQTIHLSIVLSWYAKKYTSHHENKNQGPSMDYVYHLSDVEDYNISETKEHTW